MATGTSIYTPTEMLGDGTATSTTFLRGDKTWATPSTLEITPEEFQTLLTYAFQRIMFLEAALKIEHTDRSIPTPNEFELIEDRLQWK